MLQAPQKDFFSQKNHLCHNSFLVQYKYGTSTHVAGSSSATAIFLTPLFTFLFRKMLIGFYTTQHTQKSHDPTWPLNLKLHKCAGRASS